MAKLPNLFVVGAAKSGTTALYHFFKAHPQIYVSSAIKEANYMAYYDGVPNCTGPGDSTAAAGRSIAHLTDYLALFDDRKDEPFAADISPVYLHNPRTAARIAKMCPDAKIVMILRNPIEGVFSMFSMMHRDRREPCLSFNDAFRRTNHRMAAGWEWAWDYRGCFLYSQQVARYLNHFPVNQLFIRRYEELKQTPELFYRNLMDFIGVDMIDVKAANRKVNKSARRADVLRRTWKGKVLVEIGRAGSKFLPKYLHKWLNIELDAPAFKLSAEDRTMLADHYRADIARLAELLNWNLDDWLQPPSVSQQGHSGSANTEGSSSDARSSRQAA